MSSKLTKLETILTAIFDRVRSLRETEKLYKHEVLFAYNCKAYKTYSDFDNVYPLTVIS